MIVRMNEFMSYDVVHTPLCHYMVLTQHYLDKRTEEGLKVVQRKERIICQILSKLEPILTRGFYGNRTLLELVQG